MTQQAAVGHVNLRRSNLACTYPRTPSWDPADQERCFEEVAIGLDGARIEPEPLGRAADDEEIRGLGREEPKQARQLPQFVRIADLSKVAPEGGLQVARKPRLTAASRTVQRRWIAASDDALYERTPTFLGICDPRWFVGEERVHETRGRRLDLGLGKGRETDNLHPAGKGLERASRRKQIRRAREQEPAGAGIAINRCLDLQQQVVAAALHLVDEDGTFQICQHARGVGHDSRPGGTLIEIDHGSRKVAFHYLEGKRALAHLPGAHDHDDPGITERLENGAANAALDDLVHASQLLHFARCNSYKSSVARNERSAKMMERVIARARDAAESSEREAVAGNPGLGGGALGHGEDPDRGGNHPADGLERVADPLDVGDHGHQLPAT